MKPPIEIRAYTDYDPIRIFSCLAGNPDEAAAKAGLSGAYTIIPDQSGSFPASREYRAAWKVSGGRIIEDAAKRTQIAAARAQGAAEKQSILSKIGVSEAELKKVIP